MTYRIRKLTTQDVEVCHDIQHTSHFAMSEYLWTPQMWNFIARTLTAVSYTHLRAPRD